MSTTYYICRKHEYERSEAIISYTERIRRNLFSYLDASLPLELKDDHGGFMYLAARFGVPFRSQV